MPRRRIICCLLFLAALTGSGTSSAYPTGPLDVQRLLNSADLAVVGRVTEVRELASTSLQYGGNRYAGQSLVANIQVDETIKGEELGSLEIRFENAQVPGVGIYGPQLSPDQYSLFFLTKKGSGWILPSTAYSVLPAGTQSCPASAGQPSSPQDRVLLHLTQVLCSPNSSYTISVIELLRDYQSPFIIATLKSVAMTEDASDVDTQIAAIANLISRKETSVFPKAEWAILQDTRPAPYFPRSNLLGALAFDGSPEALAILEKALKMKDAGMRTSVAQALGLGRNQQATDLLISALRDPQHAVQVAAIDSLGNITKQYDWQVIADKHTFSECLQHWREFAIARKTH